MSGILRRELFDGDMPLQSGPDVPEDGGAPQRREREVPVCVIDPDHMVWLVEGRTESVESSHRDVFHSTLCRLERIRMGSEIGDRVTVGGPPTTSRPVRGLESHWRRAVVRFRSARPMVLSLERTMSCPSVDLGDPAPAMTSTSQLGSYLFTSRRMRDAS